MPKILCLGLFVLGLLSLSGTVAAQSSINESAIEQTLYVDAAAEGDPTRATGDIRRPFQSLATALERAVALQAEGRGVRVRVRPGVYRERIELTGSERAGEAPLIIEADGGDVIVSGSDVWTQWRALGDGRFAAPWPHDWGLAPTPNGWEPHVKLQPIVRRREMVFINGQPMAQVIDPAELEPGAFYVDEDADTLILCPPDGVNPGETKVEVAIRRSIFRGDRMRNVALRGFTFEHDTTPVQGGAVNFTGSDNILVEDCVFRRNNWTGVGFSQSSRITVRRVVSQYNGGTGISGWRCRDMLFEDIDHSYNNVRGVRGGFTGWAVGGCKFLHIHNAVFRRVRSIGNHTRGFWLDCDCINILIEDCQWTDNLTNGAFLEGNPGPITIRNTLIARNKDRGIISTNTAQVTIEDSIIYHNGGPQLWVAGHEIRQVHDYATGETYPVRCENWALRRNVIAGDDPRFPLVDIAGWDHFLASYTGERNCWHHPSEEHAFELSQMAMSLNMWQVSTGSDLDSLFAPPQLRNPQNGDFEPGPESPLHSRDAWPVRDSKDTGPQAVRRMKQQQIETNWSRPYDRAADASPDRFVTVDLRPLANLALTGEASFFGRGLEHLRAGTHTIHGVPFEVIDQQANDAAAIVMLRSYRMHEGIRGPLAPDVAIDLDTRAESLYFLHGLLWAGEFKTAGCYRIVYADGETVDVPLVAYGAGSEHLAVFSRQQAEANIQDWWPSFTHFEKEQARKVIIADPDDPLRYTRYLYTMQWVNPRPDKIISSVRMLTEDPDQEASLFLVALTILTAN